MKHYSRIAISLVIVFTVAASTGWAQYQGGGYVPPINRPAISPYLSILRQGGTPAANYYELTRPQLDYNSGINSLQNQTMANRNAISSLEGGATYTTGHKSGFMNYGRFFMNNGSGGAPIGGAGGGGAGRASTPAVAGSNLTTGGLASTPAGSLR